MNYEIPTWICGRMLSKESTNSLRLKTLIQICESLCDFWPKKIFLCNENVFTLFSKILFLTPLLENSFVPCCLMWSVDESMLFLHICLSCKPKSGCPCDWDSVCVKLCLSADLENILLSFPLAVFPVCAVLFSKQCLVRWFFPPFKLSQNKKGKERKGEKARLESNSTLKRRRFACYRTTSLSSTS